MNLKPPLTYREQICKLKSENILIENEVEALNLLSCISYYRLSGYALSFRLIPSQSIYQNNTSFKTIYQIYQFDEQLRTIFRTYIEKIEVYFRTQISYGFATAKCTHPPFDQHYDEQNFYNKTGYREVMTAFRREQNYFRDSLIVKHHKSKYENKMPLWVMTELMSFSNLSKLYNSMYLSEKECIAKPNAISCNTLENHLHCLSVLRNKCAHAARLYNTVFYPPARFTKHFLQNHPEIKNTSLFAYSLILLKRLPGFENKQTFIQQFQTLMEKYSNIIDRSLIGVPENYLEIMMRYIA